MKQSATIFLMMVLMGSSWAIDTISVASTISDVTVYYSGAQVTRKAEIKLKPGLQLLAFEDITFSADPNSITINTDKDCDIYSFLFKPTYNPKVPAYKKEHQRKSDSLEIELKLLNNQYTSLAEELNVLNGNEKFENVPDLQNSDIQKISKYFNQRTVEIFNQQLAIEKQTKWVEKQIKENNKSLSEKSAKIRDHGGSLMVLIDIKSEIEHQFTFSYFTENAQWVPSYDFRVKDVISPLNIVYQANIIQSTAEDWSNVNLVLSTGSPNESSTVPVLEPWYFEKGDPNQPTQNSPVGKGGIVGLVMDESKYFALPGCRIIVKNTDGKLIAETTTSHNGLFSISPLAAGKYSVEIQYLGYKTKKYQAKVNNNTPTNLTMDLTPSLEEELEVQHIVSHQTLSSSSIKSMPARSATDIAKLAGGVYSMDNGSSGVMYIRGSRSNGRDYYIDGIKVRGDVSIPASSLKQISVYTGGTPAQFENSEGVYETQLPAQFKRVKIINSNLINQNDPINIGNLEYKIAEKQSLLSNGKKSTIEIQTVSIPVEYIYTAVPKYSPKVYLEANLTNWFSLNLLPATANIFYQGTFAGNTIIDPYATDDTLAVSLGIDNSIVVSKTENAEETIKDVGDKTIKETVSYVISVNNNKSVPIRIKVKDQLPTTQLKSVTIEHLATQNENWDTQTGFVMWEMVIPANQNTSIPFVYTAKYPTGYAY